MKLPKIRDIIKEESLSIIRRNFAPIGGKNNSSLNERDISGQEFISKVELNIVYHDDYIKLGIAKDAEEAKTISPAQKQEYAIRWCLE